MVRSMHPSGPKLHAIFSMVAVLSLFMATSVPFARVWAAEPATSTSEHPSSQTLTITDGKLTGRLKDRPLAEILDFIGKTMGFEYQANKQLRAKQVSHNFHQVPLMEATKKILAPFNYMIETDGSGKIKHLSIIGLRVSGRPHPTMPSANPGANIEGVGKSAEPTVAIPGEDLMKEKYPGGKDPSGQNAEPPIEMHDAFYPEQVPGTELTGPTLPEGHIPEEFIPFEPSGNERAPMAPNRAKVGLPEFEPVISDTGPSTPE